jgi:TonB family protein
VLYCPFSDGTPTGTLRCVSCSLEPVFIDDKVQGRIAVHITIQVGTDGTVETAKVDKSPSDALAEKLRSQMATWLFEPPKKDGQPIRVKNESDITVNVVRPR